MKSFSRVCVSVVFIAICLCLIACSGDGKGLLGSSVKIDKPTLTEMVKEVMKEKSSPYEMKEAPNIAKISYKKFPAKERLNQQTGIKETVVPLEVTSIGFAKLGFPYIGEGIYYHMDVNFTAICYEGLNAKIKCELTEEPKVLNGKQISGKPKLAKETIFEEL